MEEYVGDRIRNFSIVAHVDHGKSTLADRLLEHTGTIQHHKSNKQVLDKLQVERERGITVKAQTSSMFYQQNINNNNNNSPGATCLFNLIDTPGHVDFGYEVSRSLRACQGVLLVVDAAQGIEAQTVANHNLAWDNDLVVLPVVNKIDLAIADVDRVCAQIERIFGYDDNEIIRVSAKEGIGIPRLLDAIHQHIPAPSFHCEENLSLFLFDSWYDPYRGVVCLMALRGGVLRKGDVVVSAHWQEKFTVQDIGVLHPHEVSVDVLCAGQVGYVVMGMREVKKALIGDTFYKRDEPVPAVDGFEAPKPMVFAGMYPTDQSLLPTMRKAIQKLCLNDASVDVNSDNSAALGQGWRIGFLGLLHMDVFKERLLQEHGVDVIVTSPTVPYRAHTKKHNCEDDYVEVRSAEEFPYWGDVKAFYEPKITGTMIFPEEYLGKIIKLCQDSRGDHVDLVIDDERVILKYKLPLNEIVMEFVDKLKFLSSGYASFDYEYAGYEEAEMEKMEIVLNGKLVDALSVIVHKNKARDLGKTYVSTLKDKIPRQQFEIVIQAVVRGKSLCKEVIRPYRKDVFAKWGGDGGDQTRKRKLLDAQKEGKKKLKSFGKVEVPHDAFLSLIKR